MKLLSVPEIQFALKLLDIQNFLFDGIADPAAEKLLRYITSPDWVLTLTSAYDDESHLQPCRTLKREEKMMQGGFLVQPRIWLKNGSGLGGFQQWHCGEL